MKQGLGDKKNMRDNLERHHRFKIVNQHSAPALGLAEILEKMKFCTLNFASYVFGSKIQFEKHFTKQFFLKDLVVLIAMASTEMNTFPSFVQ